MFIKNKLISRSKCKVIPGSGVNTSRFKPVKNNIQNENFQFLFIGRLLYDKGIKEYVDASRKLKLLYPNTVFNILGPLYKNNATAVSIETLDDWTKNGDVNYLGETDNVEDFMKTANCIVLPSYREGLSKVLIEASSLGLPVVTTNVPGCRDVVINNETGFLCKVKSSEDLTIKMKEMLLLPKEKRMEMGEKARKRALEVFDEKIIIKHYKDAIYSIV